MYLVIDKDYFLACVASVSNRVIARIRAEAKKKVVPLPLPCHSCFFFCSCPSFVDEPREETLATQANHFWDQNDHCEI